jgi:N-acetyltransferase
MAILDVFERPPTLEGELVRMEPLAEGHREPLRTALADAAVWRWVKIDVSGDPALFATVRRADGAAIGSSRYLSFRPDDLGLEIGWTLVSRSAWGGGANSEAKLLMLEHAFEQLGCARVEFKTDALNERARAALAALPSRFEGIFHKHMLMYGGRWRDSAWYAITDEEWPETKRQLRDRMAAQGARGAPPPC